MWSVILFLLCTVFIVSPMSLEEETQSHERGRKYDYTVGWHAECPGTQKPVKITKKGLQQLRILVQGKAENVLMARRASYNYYQMANLPKDKDVDFKKRKTFLYVGGYMDSPTLPVSWAIGRAYNLLDYNVLLLDSSRFTVLDYALASRYMRQIGKHAAEMIYELVKAGLDMKDLEMVGLSLGAHTMSFLAKHLKKISGQNVTRLIGLDPSGPCFRNLGPDQRLDKSDADFVEMVCTNIDGFGMAHPIGHVNFYVNGGEYQMNDMTLLPCDVMCSHLRSYLVWIASLSHPNSFIGMQCDSVKQARNRDCYDREPRVTNILGQNTDPTKEGIFYVSTRSSFPYFMGKKGLIKENDFVNNNIKDFNRYDAIKLN